MNSTGSPHIAIRLATGADTASIARLAALDSAEEPRGATLVAAVDDSIIAALPLGGGIPIADPFRPTADARELLALRASQLPPNRRSRRRHLPRIPSRRRGVGSPATA